MKLKFYVSMKQNKNIALEKYHMKFSSTWNRTQNTFYSYTINNEKIKRENVQLK